MKVSFQYEGLTIIKIQDSRTGSNTQCGRTKTDWANGTQIQTQMTMIDKHRWYSWTDSDSEDDTWHVM